MARRRGQIVEKGENKFLIRFYVGTDSETGKPIRHAEVVDGSRKDGRLLRVLYRDQRIDLRGTPHG